MFFICDHPDCNHTFKGVIMGLDMYLSAKKYFYSTDDDPLPTKIAELVGISTPVQYISFRAMYWRKCFQVNDWFIDILDDRDVLQECEIDRENLEDLLNQCKLFLKGEPSYFKDGEEVEDLKEEMEITVEGLEKCLKEFPESFWFTYCASW